MPCPERVEILGCPFDAVSFDQTLGRMRAAAAAGRRMQIVPANVDFIMQARRDPVFASELGRADLVVADGVPVLWAAALLGRPLKGRVSGTDLAWRAAGIAAELGRPVAIVGGRIERTRRAAARMARSFPGARVIAFDTPFPLDPPAAGRLVAAVRAVAPAILLVALGAPRQERFVQEHLAASGASVGIGVGSALDILSGAAPRAPAWMKDRGFEWLWRMAQEPRRLGRRYLVENSPFVLLVIREMARRRRPGWKGAADA